MARGSHAEAGMGKALGWIVRGAILVALAAGCSGRVARASSGDSGAREASPYCPATLAQTNGQACPEAGLECSLEFLCSDLPQEVVCACKSARFECHDPIGLLPPAAAPRCLSTDPKKFYCPASMALAQGLTCTENAQTCFYDGAMCSNGLTKLNYCECAPDGFGGLVFGCHIVACEPNLEDGGASAG